MCAVLAMVESGIAAAAPKYPAAEASKHIGQFAVKYAQLNENNEKLKKARAEAKTRAKNVATQPNIQATQNEKSFTKSEVTPESIPEAFVLAYSGMDVDALAGLYGDRVDHTNSGVISNAAVRAQAKEYFARWPVRQWSLVGTVNTVSLGTSKKKVVFSATYDASDPQTNKHASGIAKETLILAPDPSGAMKIISQREQLSNQNSSRSDEKTSDDPGLKTAKAEYEASSLDETARVRYVTKLADMSAQLTPKILHNPDLDTKVAYANQAGAIGQELRKHPMPRNVDSGKLSQLLLGKWESPRHVYIFRADGTYGMVDTEESDKWRIDGNEYIDAFSRGPIILLDRNYFIYACGQGVIIYTRVKDSEAEPKPFDLAIKQKLLGYWKFPRNGCYIAAGGKMYMCPRKDATETNNWDLKDGKFYWNNVPYTIVTLNDTKFVYREIGAHGTTFTLIRGTKEDCDPE